MLQLRARLLLLAASAQSLFSSVQQLSVLLLWVPAVLLQLSRQAHQAARQAMQQLWAASSELARQLLRQVRQARQLVKSLRMDRLVPQRLRPSQALQILRLALQRLRQALAHAPQSVSECRTQAALELRQLLVRARQSLRLLPARLQPQAVALLPALSGLASDLLRWLRKVPWQLPHKSKLTQFRWDQRLQLLQQVLSGLYWQLRAKMQSARSRQRQD